MASGSTSNLGLSQWSAEDRVTREDFNADNLAIDAALASVGNCRIETGSYVGDGVDGRIIELTFSGKPMVFFVGNQYSPKVLALRDGGGFGYYDPSNGGRVFNPSWDDNHVRWAANSNTTWSLNENRRTYQYIALTLPSEEETAE